MKNIIFTNITAIQGENNVTICYNIEQIKYKLNNMKRYN